MNPDKINSEVTKGNFGLEVVLKEIARNLGAPLITGNIYFVVADGYGNSVQFNQYYGRKYEDGTEMVQTTLADALTACEDDRGDFIFIAPGHALTVTATNVDLNKNGVTIVGLGNGENRPTFTFGAAAATMTVSADDVTVKNLRHFANFLDVASAYTLSTAKNFRVQNSIFEDSSSILNFLSIVTTDATDNNADDLTVVDNSWYGLNTTPLAFVSILAALLRPTISRNFCDLAATSGGEFITLAAKIVNGAKFQDNIHTVVGATGTTTGIFLTGSGSTSTGIVSGNMISSLDTTSEIIATTGTGLVFHENYYTGTADASGKLLPAVDAA